MNKIRLITIAAILLTLDWVLGAQKPIKQWQYAQLYYDMLSDWKWVSPDTTAIAKDLDDLCEQLAIEVPSNEDAVFYTIVDWAGSQGWELVIIRGNTEYTVGWFKRPE